MWISTIAACAAVLLALPATSKSLDRISFKQYIQENNGRLTCTHPRSFLPMVIAHDPLPTKARSMDHCFISAGSCCALPSTDGQSGSEGVYVGYDVENMMDTPCTGSCFSNITLPFYVDLSIH